MGMGFVLGVAGAGRAELGLGQQSTLRAGAHCPLVAPRLSVCLSVRPSRAVAAQSRRSKAHGRRAVHIMTTLLATPRRHSASALRHTLASLRTPPGLYQQPLPPLYGCKCDMAQNLKMPGQAHEAGQALLPTLTAAATRALVRALHRPPTPASHRHVAVHVLQKASLRGESGPPAMRLQPQLAASKRLQEVNSADRPALSPLHLRWWDATSGADPPTPSHDRPVHTTVHSTLGCWTSRSPEDSSRKLACSCSHSAPAASASVPRFLPGPPPSRSPSNSSSLAIHASSFA
ncbi:hypothetical protein K505DRAFT_381765 [Melanomma pulvis-pyrius CBS 109.77]|uniref:Uncharacterized protein n=1 Tax=Melanomma pulvis-pyrius CBS 109.77 TaxID=1314802 RepID=A0A6A6XV21_9PLEO|nr:hypothetical protein K505DRAFT_381765 [Melanomma pulvis-pyrius CBS 109.77]